MPSHPVIASSVESPCDRHLGSNPSIDRVIRGEASVRGHGRQEERRERTASESGCPDRQRDERAQGKPHAEVHHLGLCQYTCDPFHHDIDNRNREKETDTCPPSPAARGSTRATLHLRPPSQR